MTTFTIDERKADYIKRMKDYIDKLKELPPQEAKEKARERLIRTGVLDREGNPRILVK